MIPRFPSSLPSRKYSLLAPRKVGDSSKCNAQAARCTGEIAVKGFRGDLESVRCPISRCTGNEDVAPHYAKQENAVQIPLQNAVVWGGGVWYNAEHEKWGEPNLVVYWGPMGCLTGFYFITNTAHEIMPTGDREAYEGGVQAYGDVSRGSSRRDGGQLRKLSSA